MVSAAPVWFSMLVQFVVAMIATISFGITFQVGRRHYWTCGFVGAVGWTIYIACTALGGMTAPMATLIATLPLAALSRFFCHSAQGPHHGISADRHFSPGARRGHLLHGLLFFAQRPRPVHQQRH